MKKFLQANQLTNSFLDGKRQIADPVADSIIEAVVQEKGIEAARQLFEKLTRNIELPIAELPTVVQDFIQNNSTLPTWHDSAKLDRAYDIFVDHGPEFLVFLYYKSLPTLYACAHGAKVLIRTGRLAHSQDDMIVFSRRIAETGQFLLDVMAPKGLSSEGKGIESILKVRLIHSSIRHFVKQHAWDYETLGQPINQEDLAITMMTFGYSLINASARFGIENSNEDKDAFIHLWNCTGYLLGIDEDLMPQNYADAEKLHDTILERQAASSEEGILLTKALITFADKQLRFDKISYFPQLMIKFLTNDKIAGMLAVSVPLGCLGDLVPNAFKSFFKWVDKLEDRSESLEFIINLASRELTKKLVGYFNNYKGVPFTIPKNLREKWDFLD